MSALIWIVMRSLARRTGSEGLDTQESTEYQFLIFSRTSSSGGYQSNLIACFSVHKKNHHPLLFFNLEGKYSFKLKK